MFSLRKARIYWFTWQYTGMGYSPKWPCKKVTDKKMVATQLKWKCRLVAILNFYDNNDMWQIAWWTTFSEKHKGWNQVHNNAIQKGYKIFHSCRRVTCTTACYLCKNEILLKLDEKVYKVQLFFSLKRNFFTDKTANCFCRKNVL